jgi:hypothetical protein
LSGLRPFTEHPDRRRDPHEQARLLASDALREPLGELDAAWLDDHLAGCSPCRAEAEDFLADAALLRSLRDVPPPAPRDLGARVSLALDEETRRALRRRAAALGGRRQASGSPLGSLRGNLAMASGVLAGIGVAVLAVVLAVPLGLLPVFPPFAQPPVVNPLPAATPIVVDTHPVAWVRRTNDGRYVISSAEVDRVCPGSDATPCGTLDSAATTLAALDVRPSSILLPRDGSPAVVVGDGVIYAITVTLAAPVTSPAPDASPLATGMPAHTPAAPGASVSPPTDPPAPPGVLPPVQSPDPDPPVGVSPTPFGPRAAFRPAPPAPAEPRPSPPPAEATVPLLATPGVTPWPDEPPLPWPETPLPTLPPPLPEPTPAAVQAIAEGVVLVGAPPAYSPNGQWLAFSARPSDGSRGPDVYVWRVGDPLALPITTDQASVFAGWLGDRILASTARLAAPAETDEEVDPERESATGDATVPSGAHETDGPGEIPGPEADPAAVVARSFVIDPVDGSLTWLPRDGIWLPVVDPTDRLVVFWTGSLAWSPVDLTWLPATGWLAFADWRAVLDGSADLEARPLPLAIAGSDTVSFEVAFDPAGRRLGVWVADPIVPGSGYLALIAVTDDGSLGEVLLADVAALPGFSLGTDRLAWSTPPGRNGQGSQVTVFAWKGEHAGQVYSIPDAGDHPLVVAR